MLSWVVRDLHDVELQTSVARPDAVDAGDVRTCIIHRLHQLVNSKGRFLVLFWLSQEFSSILFYLIYICGMWICGTPIRFGTASPNRPLVKPHVIFTFCSNHTHTHTDTQSSLKWLSYLSHFRIVVVSEVQFVSRRCWLCLPRIDVIRICKIEKVCITVAT